MAHQHPRPLSGQEKELNSILENLNPFLDFPTFPSLQLTNNPPPHHLWSKFSCKMVYLKFQDVTHLRNFIHLWSGYFCPVTNLPPVPYFVSSLNSLFDGGKAHREEVSVRSLSLRSFQPIPIHKATIYGNSVKVQELMKHSENGKLQRMHIAFFALKCAFLVMDLV